MPSLSGTNVFLNESIDTTMKYYVGKNAERTAAMMATVKKQTKTKDVGYLLEPIGSPNDNAS